jgi:hypothetical protein
MSNGRTAERSALKVSREEPSGSETSRLVLVHRRFGWTALFVWMTFGLVVELLHGSSSALSAGSAAS